LTATLDSHRQRASAAPNSLPEARRFFSTLITPFRELWREKKIRISVGGYVLICGFAVLAFPLFAMVAGYQRSLHRNLKCGGAIGKNQRRP
jgi:hypothetical protein